MYVRSSFCRMYVVTDYIYNHQPYTYISFSLFESVTACIGSNAVLHFNAWLKLFRKLYVHDEDVYV